MNTGGNNIAYFIGSNGDAIGGMETHAKYFCQYFNEKGNLTCIVRKEFIWDCMHNKKYYYFSNEELVTILKTFDVKILFFNDGHWIEDFSTLRKRFPSSIMIMRSGGNEFMKAPVTNMSLPIFERQKMWAREINTLDYVISNSSYSTHRMISIGIMKDKIVMVRGGVDTALCLKYSRIKSELRKKLVADYKIDPDSCLLGIVSRFEKFKGIEQAIETLSKIREKKWHLFIAGSGTEYVNILEKLNKYLKPSQYTLFGQLNPEQSLKLIAAIDFLLNMSLEYVRKSGMDTYIHTETMGRSMMEAVCCRTPVIATKVGGIPELFEEQDCIGTILENQNPGAKEIEEAIKKEPNISLQQVEKYDWSYIFGNIYEPMMNIKKIPAYKINLVIDLEDSIIHKFFDKKTNRQNFEKILHLSNICNVIINTAGELDNIFEYYPYINDYVRKMVIIANCGRKVLLFGKRFDFWEKYYESLFAPGDKLIEKIIMDIESRGEKVTKVSRIDKLYINFKVSNINESIIDEVNKIIKNTPYKLCSNNNNVKLISEEVEKGNTLRFICGHILGTSKSIGIGNGVLDMSFLDLCSKAYFINPERMYPHYTRVEVRNQLDMKEFLGVLENEVKKESFNSNG